MTIKLTLKQMKQLRQDCDYIIKDNELHKIENYTLGNTYYYANYLGCRIRVQEVFTISNLGTKILNTIVVNQDYERLFIK